jgi:SAM-dependent methyltransferase/uncharacterized protein GlcG (DUF336 family)
VKSRDRVRGAAREASTNLAWIERDYRLDPASGVYRRDGAPDLPYSDGERTEEALLALLRRCEDRSLASLELRRAIDDWPSEYHLSPARANLLRHLGIAPSDTVLELGAGCGALTRFLGETGARVVAVEGSARRAAIARARCLDLSNVIVVCDHVDAISATGADWVVLVGVLEYARVMSPDAGDAIRALLERARRMLSADGAMVLGIENQLGLKYFNGCAEDHAGIPYFGIESLYGSGGPVTFGRRELERRVAEAGFAWQELQLPFPDYKLPLVVLSPYAPTEPGFNVADLLARTSSRDYTGARWRSFCEALAWDAVAANGLLCDHANSFLVVAGADDAARGRTPPDVLAWSYSDTRRPGLEVATTFVRGQRGVEVRKSKAHEGAIEPSTFEHHMASERYIAGDLLSRKLLRAAEAGNDEELVEQALPWLDLLLAAVTSDSESAAANAQAMLPGDYVDAIPANVVIDSAGRAQLFDLEWRLGTPVPLVWIVLRGLALTLLGIVNSPLQGRVSVTELARRLYARRSVTLPPDGAAIAEACETRFYRALIADAPAGSVPLPASRLEGGLSGTFEGVFPLARRLAAEGLRERSERTRLEEDTVTLRATLAQERAAHAATIARLRTADEQAHARAKQLGDDVEMLRATLAEEKAMHAANIEKMRVADEQAHARAKRLGDDVEALRATLAQEKAMHAANIEKLRVSDEQAHARAKQLGDDVEMLRATLAEEKAMHAANIDKLRVSDEQAHARAKQLGDDVEMLRATLTEEKAMHAANVEKLVDAAARSAAESATHAVEVARHAAELATLTQTNEVLSAERAALEEALSRARVCIDGQAQELAALMLERSTFGARIGRWITRSRNRWLPVSTARGRAVTLANRFVVAVAGEGLGPTLSRTGALERRRWSKSSALQDAIATPPELAQWIAQHEPSHQQLTELRARATRLTYQPLLSIVLPVYGVPTSVLAAALDSLEQQTWERWEACVACADEASSDNWKLLAERAARDSRVRPFLLPNAGISGNSNAALATAKGEFVALLDHDDTLSPYALQAIVERLNEDRDLDFLYTDKDSIDATGSLRQNALFKPQWSPEMLFSVNYLTHLNVMRTELLRDIGGWRPETDGAQDWDLFLRFTERTTRIARVEGLHYHWRIIATSVATGLAAKPYAAAAQLRCQQDRLERLGWSATAVPDAESGFRVLWTPPETPNVEVIVHATGPGPLRHCLDGLRFARLEDVHRIRVLLSPACEDAAAVMRDFATVWPSRIAFEHDSTGGLAGRLVAAARDAGPPILVLIDGRARFVGELAVQEVGRWVNGAPSIAWAAGIAHDRNEIVQEAGRVATPAGTSAPLFRGERLRSWGWFGGALWHRNASAALPFVFSVRRKDLARLTPSDGHSFDRWWTMACLDWRANGRRGVITPHARIVLDDAEGMGSGTPFDEAMRTDPYFHPAFCSVSPLRLVP